VGVDRPIRPQNAKKCSFPHTRGGGPPRCKRALTITTFSPHAWGWTGVAEAVGIHPAFSPHAWGWTVERVGTHDPLPVFPTRVGVDRRAASGRTETR